MAAMHEDHASIGEIRDTERRFPSLQIRGFGDVDFSATDQKGSISGFNLGQLVLHLASPLSEKVSYFGEVSFTAQPSTYRVDVEHSIIRYDYNDYFKLSFGKYHTPIGYWNATFHHGAWLQTTIARPEIVETGRSCTPTHFVGVEAEGNIPSGGLGLGYNVGLGNGRSSFLSKSETAELPDQQLRCLGGWAYAQPAGSADPARPRRSLADEPHPQPGQNFGEWISGAYVAWTKEKPEFLAEYENVHHRNELTANTWDSQAFYVQVAYRLPWQQSKWKPYYRYEYIHKPESDPTLVDVLDLSGSTFGVRYDITNYAAFKGEYRYSRHGVDEPWVNGVFSRPHLLSETHMTAQLKFAFRVVAISCLCLAFLQPLAAQRHEVDVAVVVHPDTPISNLSCRRCAGSFSATVNTREHKRSRGAAHSRTRSTRKRRSSQDHLPDVRIAV